MINYPMYMDDIKIFAEKEKETPKSNYQNLQPKYRNGIKDWKCSMLIMKKKRKWNSGRNRTTQLEKYQNTWRKRKLQIPGNIRSGYYQGNGDKRKSKKGEQENFAKPNSATEISSREKNTGAVSFVRDSEPWLTMDKRERDWWTIEQRNWWSTKPYTQEMT